MAGTMHPLPHAYRVRAAATQDGPVALTADGLPELLTTAPPEFGGPEGHWSPETLLVAAIADCYALSFRAVARASRLAWEDLAVEVQADLDRVEGVTRFTHVRLVPRLRLAPGASRTLADATLDKAKRACLVTNSLTATFDLAPEVTAS
jgi:organic hydroperoxide reductase OsmC/OhrA